MGNKKNRGFGGVEDLAPGDKIAVAPKFAGCTDTVGRLAGRIGCQEQHLTDGSLTFAGYEKDQVLVGRPLKAGSIPVSAKFFVRHTTSSGQAMT